MGSTPVMPSSISFTLDSYKSGVQSTNGFNVRPVLPFVVADDNTQRTITINKISSALPKKYPNGRLHSKQCFLPIVPTMEIPSPMIHVDLQAKLEAIILKTADCEIIDLFNQMKSKPATTMFNDTLSTVLAKLVPSEHKYFFGSIVVTDKLAPISSNEDTSSGHQDRRIVMDQMRTLEFVQLQAFARVLQQQNRKSQATVDKLRQQSDRSPPAQLLAESIKKQSLDKITFALIMERILGKVDNLLSCVRDECYMAAVSSVHTLIQKDLGTTVMMTKIDQELSRQRSKIHLLTAVLEKYGQLTGRLLQDIQHVHDVAQHDAKEANNVRSYIHALHDGTYQHRLDRSECKIIKRTSNQLELGFFDNLVCIQLDGKAIGRLSTWSMMKDDKDTIECKLTFSTDENLNQSQQLAFELLKNQINLWWNRPLSSTISMSFLVEMIRKLIEYSLTANNLVRTLLACLDALPCKLIENKFTIDWSTAHLRLDIEWALDERLFRDCPLKSSYCCQPQHNGLCNELQTLLDRMKPVNGSVASLYEQVEQHIRPWLSIVEEMNDDKKVETTTDKPQPHVSLQRLKRSLEQLLLEQD